MFHRLIPVAFAAALLCAAAAPAVAQTDPKFEFATPHEAEKVEWKASAQAGMIVTTGNSESTTIAAGARRAATAAAEPPEEPPGEYSCAQGFLTGP